MSGPRPQPGILDIALYQGGESHIAGRSDVLKLSSNENPVGPPPAAQAALAEAAAKMHLYPSVDHGPLRKAIGDVHGLDPAQIICGVGSDEVLTFLCQAYAGVGDEVIHTEHGFSMYPILARAAGATPVCVAERERCVDVDAILTAVTPRTKLVFLTNPGNPTGTVIPMEEIARLADALPGEVIIVIDGAYAEYAPGYGSGFDGGAALAGARDNVVMTRTFSKLYGLGGLRVGWGYACQGIIDVLNRVRGPFNLSAPALAAAEAAMLDRDFARTCIMDNARLRDELRAGLITLGIACDESAANFVLARFASEAEAVACEAALREAGILVRKVKGYGFAEGLRITVGDEHGTARVLGAIRAFAGVSA
ncbi:MAG: histidinol-phosphate transaminase [Pseudomonadota bacterium]